MAIDFEIIPLTDTLGAEIAGLNVSEPLSAEATDALRTAFEKHHVLLFRDVDLSPEAQGRFARHFGETSQRELNKGATENNDNQYVSNTRPDGIFGKGELDFHIDQLFLKEPLKAIILYALDTPEEGGGTKFVNTLAVHDAMPEALRHRLIGLHRRHARAYDRQTTKDWNVVDANEDSPNWVHPLLWQDPRTGRHAIWVNKLTTVGVEELSEEGSTALLEEVRAFLYDDTYTYAHQWKSGDMILWDNRVLQHARLPFDPGATMTLRRTAII